MHGVGASGKLFEHVARIVGGTRLAQNLAIENHHGVRGNHNRRTHGARGHQIRFDVGQPLDECLRRFAGVGSLIHGRRNHGERHTCIAKDFRAPW